VRFAIGLPNVGAYGDPGLLVELGSMAEQSAGTASSSGTMSPTVSRVGLSRTRR